MKTTIDTSGGAMVIRNARSYSTVTSHITPAMIGPATSGPGDRYTSLRQSETRANEVKAESSGDALGGNVCPLGAVEQRAALK